jgi:hypothetical protein
MTLISLCILWTADKRPTHSHIVFTQTLVTFLALTLVKVTRSWRLTGEVCQRTVWRRSQEVQQVTKIIGGEDSSLILHQELRSLTKDEARYWADSDIAPEQGLAMKAS